MRHWTPWIIVALLFCSCSETKSPHRSPDTPFASLSIEGYDSSRRSVSSFEYTGETVWVKGSVEKDQTINEIRFEGTYRTSQALLSGAQLAIQVYDDSGNLLVRDLPRIPFEVEEGGIRVAKLNQNYRPSDLGIGFNIEDIVLQFNYIQEGEFWYDIEYPDIELPSLRIEKVNALERFNIRWSPIPRIVPRGSYTYLPAVFLARKAHQGEYLHHSSIETFTFPENSRYDHSRGSVESSWSWGKGRFLAVKEFQLQDTGAYLVRFGFVWDGVQWFEVSRTDNLKRVWVIPAVYYLLGMGFAFATLVYSWNRIGRVVSPAVRRPIRFLILVVGLILAGAAGTNVYGLILAVFALGLWIATRVWKREIRLYFTLLLMLSVLECCWSYLFSNSGVRLSGFLLSVIAYAVLLSPIVWIRNRTFAFVVAVTLTVLAFSNYLLLDLYYDFFKDYPSLRVIGYASQVSGLIDSILRLFNESHAISLVIAAWYLMCTKLSLREPLREDQ